MHPVLIGAAKGVGTMFRLGLLCIVALCAGATGVAAPRSVTISVDAARDVGPLRPIWRFFGADEPNYATRPDGQKLLAELGSLRPEQVYFRAHNLLSSGDGVPDFKWGSTNIYTEKDGRPVYDFKIVDGIIDTYRERGLHPYLEIGFMPEALSSAPAGVPYRSRWQPGVDYSKIYAGWSYPPSRYEKWAELVYKWTRHNVEKYGREEVERWYFEAWNEANLDFYWQGSPEEFYKLHDYAIDAVRRALPTARVGGPDVAGVGETFMDGFIKHITQETNYATGQVGTPTDFLSFHAKGQPKVVEGHVQMGIANQLKTVDVAFTRIAAVPQLAAKPIVIGEFDPEGCAACPGPQNAYRNGVLYASYTAASFARVWELARERHVNLEGALTWAFTFPGQSWFAGYRQLASNGVDLPVLNVFRLFSRLGSEQVVSHSDGQIPLAKIVSDGVRNDADVGAMATKQPDGRLAVLLWHYKDDDVTGPDVDVRLAVDGLPADMGHARIWQVDRQHADAFSAWQTMGAPAEPTKQQIEKLTSASKLVSRPLRIDSRGGHVVARIHLPLQAVALIELSR
jgi:xylan 1,4-beta-xylosidase